MGLEGKYAELPERNRGRTADYRQAEVRDSEPRGEERRSEMDRALSEHIDQIAILSETLATLADRLGPVLTPTEQTNGPSPPCVSAYGSPLARAVDQQTGTVRSLRERVHGLMMRIEV